MTKLRLILPVLSQFAAIVCFSVSASANSLKLETDLGVDTNPNRLSENFDPEEEYFSRFAINGRYEVNDNIRLFGRNESYRYFGDADDADSSRTVLGGSVSNRFKLGDKSSRLRSRLQLIDRDKTFVSRFSGERSTTTDPDPNNPGENIITDAGDRYDYEETRLDFNLGTRLDKKNRVTAILDIRDRDYADFPLTDLIDFDYRSIAIGGEWRYRLNKKDRFTVGLNRVMREYDDRRARDTDGRSIDGSDLEQYSWVIEAGYRFSPGERLRYDLSFFSEMREDNEGAYYDANRYRLRLRGQYEIDDQRRLTVSLSYSDTEYPERDDTLGADNEDDEVNDQTGYTLSLKYRQQHWSIDNLGLVATFRRDDFDSDLNEYVYDRNRLSFGIDYRIE